MEGHFCQHYSFSASRQAAAHMGRKPQRQRVGSSGLPFTLAAETTASSLIKARNRSPAAEAMVVAALAPHNHRGGRGDFFPGSPEEPAWAVPKQGGDREGSGQAKPEGLLWNRQADTEGPRHSCRSTGWAGHPRNAALGCRQRATSTPPATGKTAQRMHLQARQRLGWLCDRDPPRGPS